MRRARSLARDAAPAIEGAPARLLARTESDERLRWTIAAVAMGAFPIAGAMHLAYGISPAAYVVAAVTAFGVFVASVTSK